MNKNLIYFTEPNKRKIEQYQFESPVQREIELGTTEKKRKTNRLKDEES